MGAPRVWQNSRVLRPSSGSGALISPLPSLLGLQSIKRGNLSCGTSPSPAGSYKID